MQSARVPRGTKPTQSQRNSCWGHFSGMGSGQRWQWPDRDGSSSPQPHSHGAAGLPLQAKAPEIVTSNKTLAHLETMCLRSRERTGIGPWDLHPGISAAAEFNQGNSREGGKPVPPLTPFAGRNPCVNMTSSPREQDNGGGSVLRPQPAFLPPSPGNPPFVGSSRPCERAVCRPAF